MVLSMLFIALRKHVHAIYIDAFKCKKKSLEKYLILELFMLETLSVGNAEAVLTRTHNLCFG